MEFGVFDYEIHFIETDNFKLAAQHLKLNACQSLNENTLGVTWNAHDKMKSYIFLKKDPGLHILVHECWHAIYQMLTCRGVELEDELVAYHLDHLVLQAAKFYYASFRGSK
jgi:hypothetical protein